MKINIAKIDYKHWTINFINISGVDFADQKEEPTPASSSMYFTLEEGQTSATISYSNTYKSLHNKNLQFSYDDQNWEDWTGAKTIHAGEKLYVRGLDDISQEQLDKIALLENCQQQKHQEAVV